MPTDEHSRTDYLRALLEQRKELDANGGNLLNPSVGGSLGAQAAMDTGLGGGAVNPDVLKYDPEKAAKQNEEDWFTAALNKIIGFTDEIQAQLVSGFVGAFEGVLDLAATGLGALGDATGWYSSDPFTEWAKKDIGGRVGEYLKTYGNGLNAFRNMLDGAYFTADYWEDDLKQFANILTLGNAYEDEVDFSKSHDKYYKANDNLETPVGQFLGGAAHSIGFMLPSIMTGGAVGAAGVTSETAIKAATLASMGLSAAGKGSEEALNDGATAGKALAYGAASGAVEVVSEIVVGKALGLVGLGTGKIMGVVGSGAGAKAAKVGSKTFVKELIKTMNEEGAEEIFSAVMEPLTKAIYKGDVDVKNTYGNADWWFGTNGKFNESVLGQYASGAFVGGLMGGAQNYQTYKKVGPEGYQVLAESKNMAEAMDKLQKQKQGTAKYAAAEEGFAKAVSDFIEAENNFLGKATESQKIEIAKAFSSPNNMKELTEALASENVDKAVTEYLENYKKSNSTPEKAMAYGFLSDMQRKYGTDVELRFDDEMKNKGQYDAKSNVITLNSNILATEGGKTVAHEYFGHALSTSMSAGTRAMFYQQIKSIDPSFVKQVESTYTELGKTSPEMREEVIANFLGRFFDGKNISEQLKDARRVFGDRTVLDRLMEAFDKTAKQQKGKAIVKEYGKVLREFLKESGDESMLKAAAKSVIGETLSASEKRAAERHPSVFQTLKETMSAKAAQGVSASKELSTETDSEGNSLTKAQAEFFKDSKVRDEDGNLLVVYHTTDADFTVFDKTKQGSNTFSEDTSLGFFFASAKDEKVQAQFGKATKPYYLNITNPFNLDDYTNISTDVYDELSAQEKNAVKVIAEIFGESIERTLEAAVDYEAQMDFRDALGNANAQEKFKRLGYDGLKAFLSKSTDGSKTDIYEYIAFEPNQIKSVDNENPTANPDIRYSKELVVDYDKHPEQDPDGYIKTEDGTKLGLTDHLDEAIDDMAADGMNASDYLVGETDYKDGYISKRYVNRMEANAEMVLAAIESRYGDDFSDLETWLEDRSEQELNEFLEFAKNSANEDVCEGLQTVIDEVDGCEYPNDEPPEYDNISELIDRLTEISEAASEWPKEYARLNKPKTDKEGYLVDDKGKRMEFFHGSSTGDAGHMGSGEYGPGYYYSDSAEYAKGIAGEKGSVTKANIRMKNPLVFTDTTDYDEFTAPYSERAEREYGKNWFREHPMAKVEMLKKDGYDGYIIKEPAASAEEEGLEFYVAFDKEQISVIEDAEQRAEKARRRAEAVEIEGLIDEISKRKRFERIRSWKHFNDLTFEDVKAIDRISRGETLTHDEIMGLPLTKAAEEYCANHPQLLPSDNASLIKRIKDWYKYVYFTDQFGRDRKVLIVTGLPSAGKSSGQLNDFIKENRAIEFDNDILKQAGPISEYYDDGKGANTVHPIAAAAQDELFGDLIRLGYNFVYPTVGRKFNSLLKNMAALKKAGYEIQMIHVTVPNQVAQNRALVRYAQSGRYVGIGYIDSIADTTEKVYNEIEDLRKNGKLEHEGQAIDIKRSVEYDNSGDSPKVIRDSQNEEVQARSAETNRGSEKQPKPSARPERVSPAPRVEREHPGDANVHELEKKPKAEPKKKAPAPAAPAAPAETKKPKAPAKPYFKSIETTRDIVTDAGDLIADTLGKDKDYRIVYPKDYRETSSKVFTQINSVKDTAKEAKRLLGILSESYIEERNADGSYSEIGVVGDLLAPADESALESGIEEIIKSAADTEARSKATRSFEMQLNRAIDKLRDSKSKVSRTRVLTNQRNAIRKLIDRYAEVTDEIRAKEGLNTLLQPFSELHGSQNDAFLKRGFRANLKAALEWYSEENMDSNAKWNGIPFDPEVRQALADVYESLGESESGNLSTETMVLSSRAINVVRRLIKQMQADYITKVRPAVDQSYAAISASGYRKKTNLIAKLYRMYKRGFAPAYIVLNQMLGETSVLAKTLTFDMQKALNDSVLYRGGYSDAINKKLKELGLKKNFDRKTFQIGGKKLTADQAMFLYNALNVKANYDAINDAGITFYDENGNLARVSEVGNAAWLKSELETILPDGYKKMADFLLATMNDSVKAEYMQMYEDRYGKYSHRNEIGKVGENSYWMLFRSYERITNAEKAVKNPAGMFSHAIKRVNNENAVVIAGALSSFNAYTEQLAREIYVKPKYREALAMLNSKGSTGQNIALLLKQKVDQEDYFYLTNTLSDILGSNQFDKGTDIFSKAISAFSVAKLSLNVGTMLKQFASIWTSNIPMTKSVKGVFSNIFKSPAVKSEYRALVDELGGLKYREAGKGVVIANADSLGGIAKRAADFGMVGISKVDLFTVSSGIVSLMHIAEDQYGYKIGSEENKQWVKDHWTEFELSQIGGGALSKNAVQRGDYKQLPRLLFGFLQGANRAALGSQLNKINLWRRNRKADYQALKAAKADADSALKKAQAAYEESQSQENAQAYISAKTASIKAAMDVNDYERYRAAGGMAIPFHMAAGLAAQGIFISLINELMKHLRGKKDKDDWEFVNDPILWLLNTAKTIGIDWVPFANAVSSALFGSFERDSDGNIKVGKGYELSVPVVSIANSLVDIFNDIKEGKANLWEIGTLVGDMTGIPAETLKDYVRGIMRWYDPAMADSFQNVLYGSSMQASNKSYQHYLDRNDIGNAKSMLKSIFGQYKTGYISERVADKIARLEANGYDISVKSAMASYKDSKGNEIALSQAQAQSFRTAYAKADKAVIELMSTNEFQSATQEEQAALIKKIYDSYYAYAKAVATGQADTKIAALLAGTGGNIAVGRFIAMLAKIAQIKATKAKSRKELVLDYLKGKGLSAMDKTLILCLAGYGLSEQAKKSLNSYLSTKGMSKSDIDKFLK